jgi:II/X family phage/plasmid replication protein
MYDKLDLEIPFLPEFVNFLASSTPESPAGWVDISLYEFRAFSPCRFDNGQVIYDLPKSQKFETISSGISGMAVCFYPTGNGFNNWPHVRAKASPAKILQGHNVFGSECPRAGAMQMLANLRIAFPRLSSHLDFNNVQVKYTDQTYSARINDYFSTKIFKLFESLATAKQTVNSKYIDNGYLQLGQGSEYQRQKLYRKFQELMADLKQAKKERNHYRVDILSDSRLQEFAKDLMRFEATTGYRKFLALGIPTRLNEFLKFNDWFLSVHKYPLCRYLWECAFNPLFAQIEGHTMKNVDDSAIKQKIDLKYKKIKDNGKVCSRLATAIYNTYRAIKSEGYETLVKENNQTFFRNVKYMDAIGISRAFLKSLDPQKPNDNVVPFVQLIKIDFSNQRPDWYQEPVAGYDKPERHLRVV